MTPEEFTRGYRQLCRLLEAVTDKMLELEELLPEEPKRAPSRGRPLGEWTPSQERQVLKLRHTNGRIGAATIGRRVKPPLSRHFVRRILAETAAGEKSHAAGKKPSPPRASAAPSTQPNRRGGEAPKQDRK
jgi:hypothetical protein